MQGGPVDEFLDVAVKRPALHQLMVFGANTYREFVEMLATSTEGPEVGESWVIRMSSMPVTVVSTTLEGPLDWDATLVSGDAVDVVARLKEESDVPLRYDLSVSRPVNFQVDR